MDGTITAQGDGLAWGVGGFFGLIVFSSVCYLFCGGDKLRAWYNEKMATDSRVEKREARDDKRRAKQAGVYGSGL